MERARQLRDWDFSLKTIRDIRRRLRALTCAPSFIRRLRAGCHRVGCRGGRGNHASPARHFCPVPPAKLKYCYFWLTLAMEVPSLKSRCGASFPAPVKKAVVSGANAPSSHHCCLQEGWGQLFRCEHRWWVSQPRYCRTAGEDGAEASFSFLFKITLGNIIASPYFANVFLIIHLSKSKPDEIIVINHPFDCSIGSWWCTLAWGLQLRTEKETQPKRLLFLTENIWCFGLIYWDGGRLYSHSLVPQLEINYIFTERLLNKRWWKILLAKSKVSPIA